MLPAPDAAFRWSRRELGAAALRCRPLGRGRATPVYHQATGVAAVSAQRRARVGAGGWRRSAATPERLDPGQAGARQHRASGRRRRRVDPDAGGRASGGRRRRVERAGPGAGRSGRRLRPAADGRRRRGLPPPCTRDGAAPSPGLHGAAVRDDGARIWYRARRSDRRDRAEHRRVLLRGGRRAHRRVPRGRCDRGPTRTMVLALEQPGALRLDLWTANRDQLIAAGVPPTTGSSPRACARRRIRLVRLVRAAAQAGRWRRSSGSGWCQRCRGVHGAASVPVIGRAR